MRQKLEGKKVKGLPEEYFEYRLAGRFGWTKQEIDDMPGHWLDWMYAIGEAEKDVAGGR